MELQKAIESRMSIREFKEGRIPEEHLKQMVAAAGMAPSGKNLQPWDFVCIQNKELINKIADICEKRNDEICDELRKTDPEKAEQQRDFFKRYTLFFTKAPVLTVVYSVPYPITHAEAEVYNPDTPCPEGSIRNKNPGMQSLGAAIGYFCLKAVDLGYATCWQTGTNFVSVEIEKLLAEEIGFNKKNRFIAAVLPVGIPEDNQTTFPKKALEKIYTYVE